MVTRDTSRSCTNSARRSPVTPWGCSDSSNNSSGDGRSDGSSYHHDAGRRGRGRGTSSRQGSLLAARSGAERQTLFHCRHRGARTMVSASGEATESSPVTRWPDHLSGRGVVHGHRSTRPVLDRARRSVRGSDLDRQSMAKAVPGAFVPAASSDHRAPSAKPIRSAELRSDRSPSTHSGRPSASPSATTWPVTAGSMAVSGSSAGRRPRDGFSGLRQVGGRQHQLR